VELAAIELEGLDELPVGAEPVQVEVGRVLVEAEDLDLAPVGCEDQVLVTRILLQIGDAGLGEDVDAGIAIHDADEKALKRRRVGDAADRLAGVDVDGKIGIGLGEVIDLEPRLGLEDRIDDVGIARLYGLLGHGPCHRLEVDLDAGLLFPQVPVVDEVSHRVPVLVAEKVGRVVVVGDHADGAGFRLCGDI